MPAANTDGTGAVQPKKKVVAKVKAPTTRQVTQAKAQEQQYQSQAHAVRVQGNRQTRVMGKSPSGDRPQNRAKQMDAAILHVGPGGTGKKLHAPALPRGAQQSGSSPVGDRPQGRAQEMRAAPTVARVKKKTGGGGLLMGVAHLPKSYVGAITNSDVTPGGLDIAGNAVKDAAELAVTTPTSVAKLASTAVTHPKKVPGMLAEPYKQLAKDPAKFVSEHPVSTALMLSPAARVPGRVAGRAARVAGKQTLERPAASLPGTALKEARTGSRDVVVRAVQSRKDAKNPNPTMTVKAVQTRVDEHYDAAKQHTQRVVASAARQEKANAKAQGLSRADVRAAVQAKVEGAKKGAKTQADVRFAKEFGSTWHVAEIPTPAAPKPGSPEFAKVVDRYNKVSGLKGRPGTPGEGAAAKSAGERILAKAQLEHASAGIRPIHVRAIMKPKNAAEGVLHETRDHAQMIADRLNAKPATVPTGLRTLTHPVKLTVHDPGTPGKPVTAGLRRGQDTQPLEFTVRKVGDKYAVLPKVAAQRMYKSSGPDAPLSHQSVGTSPATGAKIMRRSRGAFTQAVLPFSAKWLAGQGTEATVRSVVAGAGPFDLLRMNRVVKRMNAHTPGSGDALMERVSGGQFGLTGAARDFAQGQKSLAHEFAGTPLRGPAAVATAVGHTAPLRATRAGFGHYSRFVMDRVNGIFENTARKAMAGQALKNSPFMERHVLGLTDKALEDAAKGLHATENQVRLAREVDRMYGKYQKFSPEMRTTLLHWTPFLPWFLNAATFLTKVLPVDHPVTTALLADTGMATEDWRKSHDLSLLQPNHVPLYMMGGYPKKGGGGNYNLGHYFPTGAASQIASSTGGLVLPQFLGPIENLKGIDWKGKRLVDSHGKEFTQGQDALRALVTAVEGQVPAVSQAGALSGVTPRYIDRKAQKDVPSTGTVLKKMLPWTPTGGGAAPVASGGSSGRVKLPGAVTGRVKVPGGVTGRVKVPGG